jgi:hypothetical protein
MSDCFPPASWLPSNSILVGHAGSKTGLSSRPDAAQCMASNSLMDWFQGLPFQRMCWCARRASFTVISDSIVSSSHHSPAPMSLIYRLAVSSATKFGSFEILQFQM